MQWEKKKKKINDNNKSNNFISTKMKNNTINNSILKHVVHVNMCSVVLNNLYNKHSNKQETYM